VTTEDFMTADWAQIPAHILSRVANRIVNEVKASPRGLRHHQQTAPTIEWE
jgi:GMP synthase (glutamine-hydrolysing)